MISLPLLAVATPSGPGWTPASLAALLLWHNSADLATVHKNGSDELISQDDLSGRGVNWIPTSGAVVPVQTPAVMNGIALFELNDTASLQTQIPPLPFVPGWGYAGPLISGYALQFQIPAASSDSIPIERCDPAGTLINAGETGVNFVGAGGNTNLQISSDLTGVAYGFLSGKWAGPICTFAGAPINCVIVNFKGSTYNQARVYWQTAASGSIPAYWTSLPFTEFTQTLNDLGNAKSFFAGLGDPGTQLFIAEDYISIDDPLVGDFNSARDYLLRWFGTVRPMFLTFGDSLTKGFSIGQALAYPYRLSVLRPGADYLNVGINSRTIPLLIADQPAYVTLVRMGVSCVPLIWAGTNDVELNTDSAATIFANLQTLCANFVADGWALPWVMPIIPRGTFNAGQNTKAAAFNALLPSGVGINWVKVIPLTANAAFNSPATSWLNPIFYDLDTVHLTAAGYQRVADIVDANS